MTGPLALGFALVVLGLIATAALPGAGLVIGLLLVVIGILLALGGFAAARRAGSRPSPR
jgi:hypothetical protein